jgi:hypothetical protein
MKLFLAIAIASFISTSAFAAGHHHVNGYTKSNGTYVSGYERTNPDATKTNNYSYPGNYNPNKGTTTGGSNWGSGSSGNSGSTYGNDE